MRSAIRPQQRELHVEDAAVCRRLQEGASCRIIVGIVAQQGDLG